MKVCRTKNMKKIIKAFVLAGAASIFSVAANAQTDNSKVETVVLEKWAK